MPRHAKSYSIITLFLILTFILTPPQIAFAAEPLEQVRAILQYAYVESLLPEEVLSQPTIEKTLETLGDPFTNYMTMDQYKSMQASLEDTSFTGLGIKIEKIGTGIEVLNVIPGSGAEKGGILKGDIVTHVNNTELTSKTTEQAVALMRGPENSTAELKIKRGSQILTLGVQRTVVNIPTIQSEMYDDSTAYIKIDTFGQDTMTEFAEMVKKYNDAKVTSWIIDIRGNMGGYLAAAQDLIGYFIGDHTASMIQGRRGSAQPIPAVEQEQKITGNVVLLVDEYSASASELFAAALKDNKKAIIIGNHTFGKGSVQTVYTIKNAGALKVTIAHFFSPQGRAINNMGVLPHLMIKDDNALECARLLLAKSGDNKTDFISIRAFGNSYEVNLKTALAKENVGAFRELISALPSDAIIMTGTAQGWNMSNKTAFNKYFSQPITNSFNDIASSPANKSIETLASYQFIQGYPGGKYYPEQTITRGEMTALLVKTMGFKLNVSNSPFTDVKTANWVTPYLAAAYQAKLVNGETASRFNPEQIITREEAAVMTVRAMRLALVLLPFNSDAPLSSAYRDLNSVDKWAHDDFVVAVNTGIIKGNTQHFLKPSQTVTRGEAADMVAEMLEASGRI